MAGGRESHARYEDGKMAAAGQPEEAFARRLQARIGIADDVWRKEGVVDGGQHMHRAACPLRHLGGKKAVEKCQRIETTLAGSAASHTVASGEDAR